MPVCQTRYQAKHDCTFGTFMRHSEEKDPAGIGSDSLDSLPCLEQSLFPAY